jgi:anti-sigma-K factor RskA
MDQQHDSKVVRWFCAAVAIQAVCMVAAAAILADVDKDKTPSVTVMASQQPQLQPSGASADDTTHLHQDHSAIGVPLTTAHQRYLTDTHEQPAVQVRALTAGR